MSTCRSGAWGRSSRAALRPHMTVASDAHDDQKQARVNNGWEGTD